ncbi:MULTISPECIES: mannonate dehydratase [Enterobacteriaceae]|uniref:mannonate dehydratase n=1 Tax=Enterobacteriaceae TaxID=543 RepID=UPI0005C84072|nr:MULTISPECIES: mannonate dehydratase [Enterobacteriaceae]MCZ3383528.1 mannonate dehydratase [Kosakonia sp. SOY2]MDZ7323330.1 mannonate dehydratase [Kosakonia sacchari]PDO88913.1 mannonate dehydratase [Kosakonia sacchari]
MQMTMRWFGPVEDKIPLEHIRQVPGVEGVVGALYDVPVGDVWPKEKIRALADQVHQAGLKMEVIESVNIHDDIKIGLPSREQLIANYQQTIRNLAEVGVKVICYNFMPVFDWMKTDMNYVLPDGSLTMAFEKKGIDKTLDEVVKEVLENSNGFALPGWEPERLAKVQELFAKYKDVDDAKLRENLVYFLKRIIPVCEEVGIKMAIHPDDPPYSIFGLPRIVKNRDDLDWICNAVDSEANGITLCTGSIAEDPDNNVYQILAEFTRRKRIHFAHVRNIKLIKDKDFYESAHLSRYGSLDMFQIMKSLYDNGFDGYIRPDHGRFIWGETGRPGYGLYDRALGVTYLHGLWEALEKQH